MNPADTNIKAKLPIFLEDNPRATMSVQEYNQLKATMSPSNFKFKIGDTVTTGDSGDYIITDIQFKVFEEEADGHLKYGFDLALVGTPFAYNAEVLVYLKMK
ncbi:MAG: hypothetical protein IPJ83_16530 [Saprospiraceae bacterium]|nr:hypothetical protein [Candidatus Vicinibacter proximus]